MVIFSNLELLEEKPSDIDSLGYDNEIAHVKMRIDRLVSKGRQAIIAYLGPFGIGKSTILHEVQKQSGQYKWVTFEMWRYSNRNELWDAFVIKLASELTRGKDEYDVTNEVEGNVLSRAEWLLMFIWVFGTLLMLTIFSAMAWFAFKDGIGIGGQFWEAYLKYAVPTIIPLLVLVGLGRLLRLDFSANKRPLRRVIELESLLFRKVKDMKKPLVVVVEDVDRSSEDAAVFLETLNYFLRKLAGRSKSKAFIVVAPQSASAFERYEATPYKGLETALKIYDEKIYFNSAISNESIIKLYDDLGTDSAIKEQIVGATQTIVDAYRRYITIRLLKHALREVVQFTEMNTGVNPVVALSIILSRYVDVSDVSGRRQIALRVLDSKQEFGSENARPFFIAIARGIGCADKAQQARGYVLDFAGSIKSQGVLTQHPNGAKLLTLKIAGIYGDLII